MRLADEIKIRAGGPGSGKHPEASRMREHLSSFGYKPSGSSGNYKHQQYNSKLKMNENTGFWQQKTGAGFSRPSGVGADSLHQQLSKEKEAKSSRDKYPMWDPASLQRK